MPSEPRKTSPSRENDEIAVISSTTMFNIAPEERLNLTDKQILDRLERFLGKKYPDFFPNNSVPGSELKEKFYKDIEKDFSSCSSLIPDFPPEEYNPKLNSFFDEINVINISLEIVSSIEEKSNPKLCIDS